MTVLLVGELLGGDDAEEAGSLACSEFEQAPNKNNVPIKAIENLVIILLIVVKHQK